MKTETFFALLFCVFIFSYPVQATEHVFLSLPKASHPAIVHLSNISPSPSPSGIVSPSPFPSGTGSPAPLCESGEAVFQKYGLNRVFLEWDANAIPSTACEAGDANSTGYFCDASQFSVMLFKRFNEYKRKVNSIVSDFNKEEKQALFLVHGLRGIEEKTGVSADFNAFLLKDNYSHQFVKDFDEHYGNHFFSGSGINIANWVFSNSPEKSGLYRVELDINSVSFDGNNFEFSPGLGVKFTLIESLSGIDEKYHTHYSENEWLSLPFDAVLGFGARDYGSGIAGDSFFLNERVRAPKTSSGLASLKAVRGKTYNDTAAGLVFGLGLIDSNDSADSNVRSSYYLKVNESVPVILLMNFSDLNDRVYYSFSDAGGRLFPASFFGERQFLLKWRGNATEEFDYFSKRMLPHKIQCSGWSDALSSAVVELDRVKQGYFSLGFFPPNTAFSVQCVSGKTTFTFASYNGKEFGNYKTMTALPGDWLAGKRSLKPAPWAGKLSLKAALGEVRAGRMCVLANSKAIALSWKSDFFSKKATATTQVSYTTSPLELCKLQPGDVLQVTNKKIKEDAAKLYWCMEKPECRNNGGYTFYGKKFDPCSNSTQYCCYKPTAGSSMQVIAPESEKECLSSPMSLEHDYGAYGTPSPEFIEEIMRTWPGVPSYALEDNRLGCAQGQEYKCSIGAAFVYFLTQPWQYKLGDGSTFTKKKVFDPLIPLAFFSYESKMGVDPNFDRHRKSIGNIEQKTGRAGKLQSTLCTNPVFERFCGYNYWWESVRHWAWLMEANYADAGNDNLKGILYKYAPPSENDTEAYIASVKRRVCHWRELWREHKEKEDEDTSAAAFRIPKISLPKFEPPKWFTEKIPQINGFLKRYVMFWSWDKDNDGIPDFRDKCPNQRETFNRFNDKDGCPDTVSESNRSRILSSFKGSIKGKRVILFVPSDFDQSGNKKFKSNAKKFFDKFLEISGLDKTAAAGSIVLVAGNVLDYESIPACRSVRTKPSMTSLSNDRVIEKTRQFWLDLDKCGRDYLRKKYGTLPGYQNYRVVALINTGGSLWIRGRGGETAVSGLSELGRNHTKNHALAHMSARVVSHELGHTFGFGEQYSSDAYTTQASIYRLKNYYAGPLQSFEDFSKHHSMWLYEVYPQNSHFYPTCLYNLQNKKTDCPDIPGGLSGFGIDCKGRILSRTTLGYKRSVMGPESQGDYGFDCYEKKAIISQWGR